MEKDAEFPNEEAEDAFHPAPTWMEKSCMVICEIGIAAIAIVVITELITRNLFGFSFEASEELGGYIIVGISFLSLPVCQVYRSYHHVQFIQQRLSPRMKALSHLVFDILSLVFTVTLLWQLSRFVMQSFRSGDISPTLLATPLWIPQTVMPVGIFVATLSLLRSAYGNWRRFLAAKA